MADLIRRLLRLHEGVRLKPYRDTAGKLTIGVGRNLDDVGLRPEEADVLLSFDLAHVLDDLDRCQPWWRKLDPVRKAVLVDMTFNLGITKLCGFTGTLAAASGGRWGEAADHMLKSAWAQQVKGRAVRLARMMRTGEAPADLPAELPTDPEGAA